MNTSAFDPSIDELSKLLPDLEQAFAEREARGDVPHVETTPSGDDGGRCPRCPRRWRTTAGCWCDAIGVRRP